MEEVKRGRGRPRLSAEEKKERAMLREQGELPPVKQPVFGTVNTNVGDNAKYLTHALAIRNMPKIDTSDPVQVRERIGWYFNHCADSDMKPTVKGLCNALGISRDTIWKWKTGQVRLETHGHIILEAYDLLEEMWENYMQNGKINPVAGIFLGKNLYGYVDKQEHVLTPNQSGVQVIDSATIEAKYAELPDDEE